MSVEDAIWSALDSRLTNTPGLPAVVFENAPTFNPDRDKTYIETKFIPVRTRAAVVGPNPQKRHQGLYEVLVATPKGIGTGAARQVASTILDRFATHTHINGNDVTVSVEYSETRIGFDREAFYCIPVSISWYAYAQ